MRVYYLPLTAGAVLAVSAFFPKIHVGLTAVGAVPAASALWTLVLGLAAILLATLSLITRKNSRHPLLLVGLIALGIEILGWQILRRASYERAWASEHARAIVEDVEAIEPPPATMGLGLYLGLAASAVICAFGFTIVVKQAAQPYAAPLDDDD